MGAVFSYSLYSGIILLVMYLCYKWVMAGENQHRFNRVALWCIYTVALAVLPVMGLISSLAADSQPMTAAVDVEGIMVTFDASDVESYSQPLYLAVLISAYMIGAIAVTLHTVWVGVRLNRVISSGEKSEFGDYTLVLIDDKTIAPFSWYRYIVMSRDDWDESGEIIATHEMQHLRLSHWLDLVFAQIVVILQWYNPAAWLMREEFKTVHEYQADSAVLEAGVDARCYQMLLIKKAVGARFPSLANSLNHSKLKKRITMMYNSKASRLRRLRGLALVPACAVALVVTNIPAVAGLISDSSSASVFIGDESAATETVASPEVANRKTESASVKSDQKPALDEIVVVAYQTASKDTENLSNEQPATARNSAMTQTAGSVSAVTMPASDTEDKVHNSVEEKPQFPGGEKALYEFFARNIRYPQDAQKAKIQGRVIAQFVVTKTGSIGDVKIVRGVYPSIDKEAIRVIKMLPAFTPGKINGKPVSVWYTIPVMFKLEGNNEKPLSIKYEQQVRVQSASGEISSNPKYVVDGVEKRYEDIKNIDPKTIERIDVTKNDGENGTIYIYLKKDEDSAKK